MLAFFYNSSSRTAICIREGCRRNIQADNCFVKFILNICNQFIETFSFCSKAETPYGWDFWCLITIFKLFY